MYNIYSYILIFIALLTAPILYSLYSKGYTKNPLIVKFTYTKNPRYFSESFRKMFSEAKIFDNTIELNKTEKFLKYDENNELSDEVDSIIYSDRDTTTIDKHVNFNKEFYSKGDIVSKNVKSFRSILSDKSIYLGANIKIKRWIDASEKLVIDKNCDLGISASSNKHLITSENVVFKRIYSPYNILGATDLKKEFPIIQEEEIQLSSEIIRDLKTVSNYEEDILNSNIITKHDLIVKSGMTINGSITSHKKVTIEANSIINGNIFSEQSIVIGENCRVKGLVFTQEDIKIGDNVIIGQYGKIKSIVARKNIEIGRNVTVFGYIGTGGVGLIEKR